MASLTSNVNDLKGKILAQGANMATLSSNVSTLTAKMLAQGTTLDATYELAQDSMGNSESVRKGMREMNDTMNDIKGEVSAMRLEFAVLKTILLERIG
jgi:methyl-accepting chemotaxis protein